MTDIGVHSIAFASAATSRLQRFATLLERSARNEAMARSTYHTLDEMPDGVLRDMGVARSEIPFVACDLAARRGDRAGRSPIARGAASRLALVAAVAVSGFAIAACTVLARDAKVSQSRPEAMRLLGDPEVDFPRFNGPVTRQLLF